MWFKTASDWVNPSNMFVALKERDKIPSEINLPSPWQNQLFKKINIIKQNKNSIFFPHY